MFSDVTDSVRCMPARWTIACALFGIALSAPNPSADYTASLRSRRQTCHLELSNSRPLTLTDGSTIHIDIQSAAFAEGSLVLAGTPAYRWARGAGKQSAPSDDANIVGAVSRGTGATTLLHSPVTGKIQTVRVANAGSLGWHFILVQTDQNRPTNGLYDSAAVWYGRFDGSRWHDVTKLFVTTNSALAANLSSSLVADETEIAFAFAFDNAAATQAAPGRGQGVVLVHGTPRAWSADTLFGQFRPSYVRLTRAAKPDAWDVAFVEPYFDQSRRLRASSVFVTNFDGHWGKPRLVADAGGHSGLGGLEVVRDPHGGAVFSWIRQDGPVLPRIQATMLKGDDAQMPDTFAVRDSAGTYALAISPNGSLAWLVKSAGPPIQTRAIVVRDGHRLDSVALSVPNDGLRTFVVAETDSTFVFVSTALRKTDREAPASTMLSSLILRCAAP